MVASDISLCQVREDEELDSFLYLFFIALVVGGYLISLLLHQFKQQFLHESTCFIVLGGITGCFAFFISSERLENAVTFDSEYFFLFLLPPIIFESGYNMNKRIFFSNLIPIISYAILGTLISTTTVGLGLYTISYFLSDLFVIPLRLMECISFGALISATDPVTVLAIFKELKVDANLYSLVFGESVLNDAIALVLYSTTVKYIDKDLDGQSIFLGVGQFIVIFGGSVIVGVSVGILLSLLYKYAYLENQELFEFVFLILYSYASYLLAQGCGLSGIVAVLFSGITMAHYARKSMSKKTKRFSINFFHIAASISETIVFLYFGLSIFYAWGDYNLWMVISTLIFCIIGRGLNIFPITFVLNIIRPKKIPLNHQVMMWFSGLRGALAFAMALDLRKRTTNGPIFLTTTLVIILFTVCVLGNITSTILGLLKIRIGHDLEESASPYKQNWWRNFDKVYLKPFLIKRPKAEETNTEL